MTKYFDVGKIVNTQGIKGEVRVISVTDFAAERYQKGSLLYLFQEDRPPIEVKVASHRKHKNFDLLTFEGYPSINQVEQFKGAQLKITEDQLHDLEEEEYYYHQIIGLTVVSEDGKEIGKIKEILPLGSNDVWVVQREGKKDVLIPYIESVVQKVSLEEQQVVIQVMEGLLGDED